MSRDEITRLLKASERGAYEPCGSSFAGFDYLIACSEGVAECSASAGFGGIEGPVRLSDIDEDTQPELYEAFAAKGLGAETEAYYFTMYDPATADMYEIEVSYDAAVQRVVWYTTELGDPEWKPWEDLEEDDLREWAEAILLSPADGA